MKSGKTIRDKFWQGEIRSRAMRPVNYRLWEQMWIGFKYKGNIGPDARVTIALPILDELTRVRSRRDENKKHSR